MRYLLTIFLPGLLAFSCVKKTPKNPVPEIEYKNFEFLGHAGSDDAAVFTIGYKDYDGDLFRNSTTDGPNTIISTYVYRADSNKFIFDQAFSNAIVQPADGYYKGQTIQGDIRIPVSEFRSDPQNDKVVKFEIFMIDMKDNKSNVLTTPQFTIQ
jgi:hypothetical protein